VSPDAIMRAVEIVLALGARLVPLIAAALDGGANEEAATRKALSDLAALPDLQPVLPKVRAMIAAARAARGDEVTREVPK
jgi:hypothetical protein